MLSERLGMTVKSLLNELSSADISEYMAFDQLKDQDYKDNLKSKMMSDEERMLKIKSLFGYKP